jgi:tRNA pseudouridine55 synthase
VRPIPHLSPSIPTPDKRNLQAINKPIQLSSAQVVRNLQDHFRSSNLFAPLLDRQLQLASQDRGQSRRNQRAAGENIKIGHGGTLDPLATGVLVLGVGKGTKQMNGFLGCTKSYETVVLFGKSTDTYDVAGKVTASAPHSHLTRTLVEDKLASFRGKIKQMPPIYSALKINGKKAYEYARTGKELPRELEARDVEVEQCEIVEWFDGGKHEYRWPITEASGEIKLLVSNTAPPACDDTQDAPTPQKRKLSDVHEDERDYTGDTKKQKTPRKETTAETGISSLSMQRGPTHEQLFPDSPKSSSALLHEGLTPDEKNKLHTHEAGPLSSEICPAPAARIRVTVSSGFYVRSFAHDLGIACDSLAFMSSLIRSRQGQFDIESALNYQDLAGGEEVWGPKLQSKLQSWNEQHPGIPKSPSTRSWGGTNVWSMKKDNGQQNKWKRSNGRERKNTSSGED